MRQFLRAIAQFFSRPSTPRTHRPIMEPLEGKQFLSFSPGGDPCAGEVCIMEAAAATPTFHLTDIIGKWKGTIQTNLRPRPFKATINITSITTAGRIKGTVSVPFLLTDYKFALNTKKSKVNSDGTFTAKFNKFGVTGQLKGHYDNASKHVVGDFTAAAPGKNVIGTFDFAKIH